MFIISAFTCYGNAYGPGLLLPFDNWSRRTKTPRSRFTMTLERRHKHDRSDEPEFIKPYLVSPLLLSAHNCDDHVLTFALHFSLSFIYLSPI